MKVVESSLFVAKAGTVRRRRADGVARPEPCCLPTPFPYRQLSIHKPLSPKCWPLCPKCWPLLPECTQELALFYRASRPDFRRIPRLAVVLGGVLTVLHDQHFIVGCRSPLTLQPVSSH